MRYFTFLITFILLLCPLNGLAADISLSENETMSGDYLEFSFDGQQSIPDEQEMKIAVYDDEGRMVSLQKLLVSGWSKSNRVPIQLEQYLTSENKGTTLKAFLMDQKLTPFADSAALGKSTLILNHPLISDTNASITVDWANEYTIALTVTASEPMSILVYIPDSWTAGATYQQGANGGIAHGAKTANGQLYVSLDNIIGGEQVILQKRTDNVLKDLEVPTIATFYDNKTAAVSITFDDGDYNSALFYDSEFEKYGFHGTAFLIADRLTGIDNWKALLAKGRVDVGNHSASHKLKYNTDAATLTPEQLQADITGSYNTLKEYFPEQPILTFASPWGQTTDAAVAEMEKNHYANRKAGGNLQSNNPQGNEWFQLKAFTYNGHNAKTMNGWIDQAIKDKGWAIELLHNCVDGSTPSGLTIAKNIFTEHMTYLNTKQDQLWVGSFNEVTAYIKERQNAAVKLNSANDVNITLSLTDSLPDDRFSQPLTLLVHVPPHWKNGASYSQGTLSGESEIVKTEDGRLYVQINAIPDQGEVVLQKR